MISLVKKQIAQVNLISAYGGLIIISHLAGVFGFLSPWRNLFLMLTPIHLVAVFVLMLRGQQKMSKEFFIFLTSVVAGTYLIELTGVQTGILFGDYAYGSALGFKIAGTPLLIGVLWFCLLYGIGMMIGGLKTSVAIKCILGAFLMVAIDLLIEPVAIEMGFWAWKGNVVPFQNYLAWFIVSLLFFRLYFYINLEEKNQLAPIVFWSQCFFFLAINLII